MLAQDRCKQGLFSLSVMQLRPPSSFVFFVRYRLGLANSLPILVHLGLETLFDLGFGLDLLLYRPDFSLKSLFCPHNLALQIETAALLGVVGIE